MISLGYLRIFPSTRHLELTVKILLENLKMPYESKWPAKTAVLPNWCDWNQYPVNTRILFISVVRTIFALTLFCVCISFLVVYYDELLVASEVLLILIITLNISQLFTVTFFTYYARSGNCEVLKRWLIFDIVMLVTFATGVLLLLVTPDVTKWHVFFGIKVLLLSVYLTYRHWMCYRMLAEGAPFQIEV